MANGISIDLIVDPKKAIDGLGQVESKSTSVSNVLGKLGGVAAAGVAALGTAAVGAVVGLTAATKSAGEYAENVELTASKTHLSTQAVQELQYAAKVTHVDIDTITGSMTKLTKSMGTAAAGNKTTAAAFKELGVQTEDANGHLLSSTDVYSNVITALGQVKNPAERDVLAMQLLGKSATELNPLIDGSAGSIAELAKQAQASGSVLSGTMLDGLGTVDDAFDKLGLGVSAAKNALGLTLMPVLTELGDQGSGLLGQFTNALLNANGDIGKAAPAIGAVVGEAATFILGEVPKLLAVGTSIVTALVQGIVQQAPILITQAVPVLVSFVTGLLALLPSLVDAGAKVLIAVVQGIATALPTLIPAAVSAVVGLVQALISNLPLILNAGLQLLTGLMQGILTALPILIAALPQIILGLITFILGAIPQLIQAGISLLTSLVSALPTIIDSIVKALPQIIVGIITAVITAIPQIIQAGIQLLVAIIGALPTIITSIVGALPQIINGIILALIGAIPQLVQAGIQLLISLVSAMPTIIIAIVKAIPQIITGLVNAFTDPKTLAQIGEAGSQLIQGLWVGIKAEGDWLWKQLTGFFGGIIDKIKGLLGIHSPSTVFAGIGGYLVAGLEKGLSGGNNIGSIMSGLSDQVTSGFGGSLNVQARATLASGYGQTAGSSSDGGASPNIQQTIVISPETDPRVAGRQFGREYLRAAAGAVQ